MKLQFLGATGEVTGSKFLITTAQGKKILLDCGMYQGKGLETDSMNRHLGFDPKEIDYLFLSHAHIDHSGLIPYICKLGFKGIVFCTIATRDLCSIMLPDSGKIQEVDTYHFNKKREKQGLHPVDPLYKVEDATVAMRYFVGIPYNLNFEITPDIKVKFIDTGHLLGGAAIYITFKENGKEKTVCYIGDTGRYDKKLLSDPEPFPQTDYIITESTYGNRLHPTIENAEQELMLIVKDAIAQRKGKLIIPSFAIGRTQDIVYTLHQLKIQGKLPDVEVFVDSPLAISATDIFRIHADCFNDEIKEFMNTHRDPFGFDKLHYVRTIDDSKRLNTYNRPCIVISASGMMEAGRVKHHLANNIENSRTTILSIVYCSPTTLGARILRGDKTVSIFGIPYKVRATVKSLEAFSGHGDYFEMIRYLSCQDKAKVKKIFIVHGEDEVRADYVQHLSEAGFQEMYIPQFREEVVI